MAALTASLTVAVLIVAPTAASARVLRVGTYRGIRGQFSSISAAVRHAKPRDWILIGPGDYKDRANRIPSGAMTEDRAGGQILITQSDLHIRGMNRNDVIVDGTAPGTPPCSRHAGQLFGPVDSAGKPSGRNGILIYRAPSVSVQNLTLCNFLTGDLGGGNQIWWDGGAGTGTQTNMGTWTGSYLSATSYHFAGLDKPAASYGIYSSNTKIGQGTFAHDYASNMSDSGFYVGACPDCNVTLNRVHAQNNAVGYSGSDSGGNITLENSEFDSNEDGVDTNSENNNDAPPPQNGSCPNGAANPRPPPNVQQTHTCWVATDNYLHDNNNPNVPAAGITSSTPFGVGLSLTGARHDIVTRNRIVNNGSWGVVLSPFPDFGTPPPVAHCQGGTMLVVFGSSVCNFDVFGNEVANNTFTHNGFFANPTNGDIGEASGQNDPGNCYHGNTDPAGPLTSDPPNIESTHGQCGVPNSANGTDFLANLSSALGGQLLCNTQLVAPCPAAPGRVYPRRTHVPMPAVPRQATMPNPCRGVPANPWCGTAAKRPAAQTKPRVPHLTG